MKLANLVSQFPSILHGFLHDTSGTPLSGCSSFGTRFEQTMPSIPRTNGYGPDTDWSSFAAKDLIVAIKALGLQTLAKGLFEKSEYISFLTEYCATL